MSQSQPQVEKSTGFDKDDLVFFLAASPAIIFSKMFSLFGWIYNALRLEQSPNWLVTVIGYTFLLLAFLIALVPFLIGSLAVSIYLKFAKN